MTNNTQQVATQNTMSLARPTVSSAENVSDRVVLEQVPAITRYLVEHLISPNIGGLRFLAYLLRFATIKKMTLWKATGESRDVAVIPVQSIEILASLSDWPFGFQTTHKVIRLLEAFGLIQRIRYRNSIEIHFFLGEPELSFPQMVMELNKLIASRNDKVRQAATRAKRHLELEQGNLFTSTPTKAMSQLTAVTQILVGIYKLRGHQIDDDLRSVMAEASQIIAYLLNPMQYKRPRGGNLLPKLGNLLPELDSALQAVAQQEISSGPQQGNFPPSEGNPASFVGEGQTQANPSLEPAEGNFGFSGFPFAGSNREPILPDSPQMGNLDRANRPKFPAEGQNSPNSEPEGNPGAALTLNVITSHVITDSPKKDFSPREEENDSNVMLGQIPQEGSSGYFLGQDLAEATEGTTKNIRAYLAYLANNDPLIVRAVFIYTRLQIRKGLTGQGKEIETPGKYFNTMLKAWARFKTYQAACDCYRGELARHGGKTSARLQGIPLEVQELVTRFSGWSYRDIAAELRLPVVQSPLWRGQELPADPDVDPRLEGREPCEPERWMETKEEALSLIAHMQEDLSAWPEYQVTIDPNPISYRPRGTTRLFWLVGAVVERVPVLYAALSQWEEDRAGAEKAILFERRRKLARDWLSQQKHEQDANRPRG